MSQQNRGPKTLLAAGTIARYDRVYVDSNGKWAQAGATNKAHAIALDAAAANEPLSAELILPTVKMKAGVAISAGALVYSAASGKIGTTGTNRLEGTAIEAATADGDIIEVIPMPVSVISL
jgi:hypothetical protein